MRDTVGDTIIVRALAGSVWPGPATLVEDLSIGALEGPEELTFGAVGFVAPDPDGGVYVYDMQAPAIRHFDSDGQYIQTVGGEGSGPGEYRDAVLGMEVRKDGRLMIRDPRNARLTLYNPDGSPSDHWSFGSGLFTSRAMVLDTADHVYLKVMAGRPEPNKPWPIVMVHLDATGELVDTVPQPSIAGDPESSGGSYVPSKVWAWSPLGYPVVGVNDEYSFEIRPPNDRVIRVERETPVIELDPEERAEREAIREFMIRTQGQNLTSEPEHTRSTKPAYKNFYFAENGDIWVHKYVPSVKSDQAPSETGENEPPSITFREPTVFDVFQPDGTYLGEVPVPSGVSLSTFGRDVVWGVRRGEFNEAYVVRFNLVVEPEDETR